MYENQGESRLSKIHHMATRVASAQLKPPPRSASNALILSPEQHSTEHSAVTISCSARCVVSRQSGGGIRAYWVPTVCFSCVVDLKPHPILGSDHYRTILSARQQSLGEHIDLGKVTWLGRHEGRLHTHVWLSQHLATSCCYSGRQDALTGWYVVTFPVVLTKCLMKTRIPWLTVWGEAVCHGGEVQWQVHGTVWPYCTWIRKKWMTLVLVSFLLTGLGWQCTGWCHLHSGWVFSP